MAPWPKRLTVTSERDALRLDYDDDTHHTLSAEFLRVLTPSAERTGHGSRLVIGGKASVTIQRIEPVGRYAVRIVFDDGHSTGLYTFEALHAMGRDRETLWRRYLDELAEAGLTRFEPGTAPAPAAAPAAGRRSG